MGAEIATRFDDWSRYGTPLGSNATDVSDLIVRDSLGLHARANSVFKYFRIDSLGFRGPDRPRSAIASHPLVVTTGASETFGLYEQSDQEWPRRLEAHLRDGTLQPGGLIDSAIVLNAAFAGMSLPTVAQDVRLRIAHYAPHVVVYYPTPAQYLFASLPRAATPLSGATTSGAMHTIRLRATQRLRDAVKRLVPEAILDQLRRLQASRERAAMLAADVGFSFENDAPARTDAFEADLRRLIGDIRAIGAEPVLVLHSHRFRDTTPTSERQWLTAWAKFYPMVSGEELIRFDALAAERALRVATDSGVTAVDPRPVLAAIGASAFADHTHFSDEGADAVAREVAPTVAALLITPKTP